MAFPGICRANSAIRCCFVETLAGPEFPGIFPSNGSMFRQPLGSSGFLGSVPRLPSYYELLRLPANHPTALRFLRLAVPPCARLFVSPGDVGTPSPGRGYLDRGVPNHCSDDGIGRISQVPGVPPCPHALLTDPGAASTPDPCGASVLPSAIPTASAPTMSFISELHHTACWLSMYASQSRSPFPTQHSIPAAGLLCRAGLMPAGDKCEVSAV